MADSEARLSCYDRAAGDLLDAERTGDILVVDRKRVERANQAAFGFNLPSFNLLDHGGKPEPVDSLQGVAAQAFPSASGGWTVVLEDGARWTQIGRDPLRHDPRPGSKIEIRKAAMGSFFLSVDGQIAIRAKRIN